MLFGWGKIGPACQVFHGKSSVMEWKEEVKKHVMYFTDNRQVVVTIA